MLCKNDFLKSIFSRSRHTTLAKEDGLLELNQREAQEVVGADDSDVTPTADVCDVTQTADDEYEEIYVSKIWRNVNKAKVNKDFVRRLSKKVLKY